MKYLILALALTSCGANDGGGSSSTDRATTPAETAPASQASPFSYYVDDISDLKACNGELQGALAYVKSTNQFVACDKPDWKIVDVRGKDGSNGKDAPVVGSNQWYDAINSKYWTMTNIMTNTTGRSDSNSPCTGNYRMPTSADVVAALMHGLGTASGAITSPPAYIMPTLSSVSANGYVVRVTDAAIVVASSAAQFCIQK